MSLFKTKSKNIHLYKHFFQYEKPADINFKELAKELVEKPNKLRALIRPALKNFTIYVALRRQGYTDSEIPSWFLRPSKPITDIIELEIAATKRSSTPLRSETAQTAEIPSAQRPDTTPKYVGVPRETANRSAVLSGPERSQRSSAAPLATRNGA